MCSAIVACQEVPSLSPKDYSNWFRDPEHGFVHEVSANGFQVKAFYEPAALRVLHHLGVDADTSSFTRALEEQEGSFVFNLKIRSLHSPDLLSADLSADQEYFERLYYFTSLVEEDLLLVLAQDTLPCALAHFERTYGAVPYETLVASFVDEGRPDPEQDLQLIYRDRALGLGEITFEFDGSTIKNQPVLRFP